MMHCYNKEIMYQIASLFVPGLVVEVDILGFFVVFFAKFQKQNKQVAFNQLFNITSSPPVSVQV